MFPDRNTKLSYELSKVMKDDELMNMILFPAKSPRIAKQHSLSCCSAAIAECIVSLSGKKM